MKGGLNGLKGRQISLVTIVLMSTTILMWAWLKTPLLTSLVPVETRLQVSPELRDVVVDRSEQELHVGKGVAALAGRDAREEESGVELETPLDSGQDSHKSDGISSERVRNGVEDKGIILTSNKVSSIVGEEASKVEERTSVDREHNEKAEEKNSDLQKPTDLSYTNISDGGNREDKLSTHLENPGCNYAKGKWVVGDKQPVYSGFGCKQWLSGMWACRLTQRTDFAYEMLRWQPKDCQMEEFEGSKFLKRMQDKTLAFVGDSLGRQQFQSLMCMVTGGNERNDVIDVGMEYGIAQARGDARPSGWAFRFPRTNTTILYYWSASLCDVQPVNPADPATDYAMHLDRPPAFLVQYLHKFDVVVLNTGHHWNRGKLKANRWVMYVGGEPNKDRKIAMIWKAKNLTVHSVVNWVNSQLPKYPGLKVFYRSISPRHFVGGDWNTGGSCDNTKPMSVGKEVLQDESSDESAAGAVKGTGVKLLDITALSQLRDEGHISRFRMTAKPGMQDCLHWCLPGVPDTWNEILFNQI
ncbi:protein trichome birefringence-like 16 [Argentina anserina]|uniref:protein trichome birefringence-like 16 n=1 Tax=Argentina anserina TaxID=57926 RepID=UPI0021769035|nr:protein trichome birefringence-like 16 [Potentilla anserina]XP_050364309.1 protein trichome birefringence-like 16 [Potentilla anserina]